DLAIVTQHYMSGVGIVRGGTLPLCVREFPDEREINPVSVLAGAIFVVTPECLCSRAGARDVLPLRFGQKPVGVPGLSAQPLCIGLGFVPTYANHRVATGLGKWRRVPVQACFLRPVRRLMDIAAIRIA